MGEFRYEGHRIEYDSYGEGKRLLFPERLNGELSAFLAEVWADS